MLRKIGWGFLIVFILLSLLPYLFPVTKATEFQDTSFPESQYAVIDTINIHYRVWLPDGEGTPTSNVLFVHGLAGSTYSWRENVEVLRKAGYAVVAVDLPGFGYSDRSRGIDHSQENRGRLVWELLDEIEEKHTGSSSNWHLVGHSMGGGTVTSMALLKPERTESIIYVDAAVLSGGNPGGQFVKYPPMGRWIEVIGRNVLLKEERITKFLSSAYGRQATADEVQGYLIPLQLEGTEGSFVDIVKTSTQTTIEELKSLQMPVRAIWGEQDSWVSVEDAYQLESTIQDFGLYVISNAYHSPMETEPQIFNKYLLYILGHYYEENVK